jgi:type IV pilus assembly protein PilC
MATFTYTARSFSGDLKTATLEASSRDDVIAQLRRQRLSVVKIDEAVQKKARRGHIKMRDVVIFTRQFSTMINAGLPLVQALNILAEQSQNKVLSDVTRKVVFDVESGKTVADAMSKHPQAFSPLYVNMVAAGEAGGILDTILMRLATFMEKNDALIRKVKGATIYPSVILSVAAIAVTVLLIFVIPVFENLFTSAGLALPLPTRVVMALSRFLKGYWYMVISFFVIAWFAYRKYTATSDGRLRVDKILLQVPVLGDVIRKAAVSRFTRTLGTLVSSGVPILQALLITRDTSGNEIVAKAVESVHDAVKEGESIVAPLEASKVFPPMVISMIDVGEETGALPEMLMKIADTYEDEVDNAVSALTSLLEPIMIVGLALIVGTIVIALFLPLIAIVNKLGAS